MFRWHVGERQKGKEYSLLKKKKQKQKTNQPNKQKHKSPYFKRQQITITKTL